MYERRINVRAIIMRGEKILAVRNKRDDGTARAYWATPGGGLDPGETLEAGLKREIMEELGVEAVVKQLLFIQQFPSGRKDADEELEFFFLVEDSPAYDSVDLTSTTHGTAELAQVDFIDPSVVILKPVFLSEIDIVTHVGEDRPVYVSNRLA